MSAKPNPPPVKEPQYGPITVLLDRQGWYAMMYVAVSMRKQEPEAFCKEAVMAYTNHIVNQTIHGEKKHGLRLPDMMGWFMDHTRVGIKRQRPE